MFVWNKFFCLCSAALCFRNYRYYALVALALVELNSSVNKCIQRIVLTQSHVVACVVLRATLANDDVTSNNLLTSENLNAKSLSC